jgi:hypothetical protein
MSWPADFWNLSVAEFPSETISSTSIRHSAAGLVGWPANSGIHPFAPAGTTETMNYPTPTSSVGISHLAVFPDSRIYVESEFGENTLRFATEKTTKHRYSNIVNSVSINGKEYRPKLLSDIISKYTGKLGLSINKYSIIGSDTSIGGSSSFSARFSHSIGRPTEGFIGSVYFLPNSKIQRNNNLTYPEFNGHVVLGPEVDFISYYREAKVPRTLLGPAEFYRFGGALGIAGTTGPFISNSGLYHRTAYSAHSRTFAPDLSILNEWQHPSIS